MASTKNRVFRISDAVYEPAKAATADVDDTLTDVVRLALAGYAEAAALGSEARENFMERLREQAPVASTRAPAFA